MKFTQIVLVSTFANDKRFGLIIDTDQRRMARNTAVESEMKGNRPSVTIRGTSFIGLSIVTRETIPSK
jgi:hypothetical protein